MAEIYDYLPLKHNHEVLWAEKRYTRILELSSAMRDRIPPATVPGPDKEGLTPLMIEAPLSSVGIFEAIPGPSEPFKIYTARHVPHGCTAATESRQYKHHRKMYHEFVQF